MEPLSAEAIAKLEASEAVGAEQPAVTLATPLTDAEAAAAWRAAFGDPADPAVQAAIAETTAALRAAGAGQAIRRDKIDAAVSHLWRASEPFQRTGTCLTELEWRIIIERLYEAIATGRPEFGGWPAPEWAALAAEKQAQAAVETPVPLQDGDVVTAVIAQPEAHGTDATA